jgi:hypothetical protein
MDNRGYFAGVKQLPREADHIPLLSAEEPENAGLYPHSHIRLHSKEKLNSVASVREKTISTERQPLVGDISASFCGHRLSSG